MEFHTYNVLNTFSFLIPESMDVHKHFRRGGGDKGIERINGEFCFLNYEL